MSGSSPPAFCGCSATRGQKKNTLLVKYEAVHMTDCRFPRPLPKNKTLSAVCCLTRKDFHFQVCMLHFPEERIPRPARTAIPRDGFVCANLQALVMPEAQGWAPHLHRYRARLCSAPASMTSWYFFSHRLRPGFSILCADCSPWKKFSWLLPLRTLQLSYPGVVVFGFSLFFSKEALPDRLSHNCPFCLCCF